MESFALRGRRRKGAIAEAVALVDEATEEVRNLALVLRPPSLDLLGLPAALRAYLERQAQRTGIDIHLEVVGLDERLPAPVETACFRLVQEALTNVVRHSGARRVDVQLSARGDALWVIVRDDGKGFDVRAAIERGEAGASLGPRLPARAVPVHVVIPAGRSVPPVVRAFIDRAVEALRGALERERRQALCRRSCAAGAARP